MWCITHAHVTVTHTNKQHFLQFLAVCICSEEI